MVQQHAKKQKQQTKQQLEKFAMVLADIASMNKTVKAINIEMQPPQIVKVAVVGKSLLKMRSDNKLNTNNNKGSAQWGKTGKWYSCTILEERNSNGKLTVQWEDGTISTNLSKNKFRNEEEENRSPLSTKENKRRRDNILKRKLVVQQQECKITPGCRGRGQFGKRGKWYPCTVVNVSNNNIVTVEWEDFTISNLSKTKFQMEGMKDEAELEANKASFITRPLKRQKKNLNTVTDEKKTLTAIISSSDDHSTPQKKPIVYNMSKTPQFKRNLLFLQQMRSYDKVNVVGDSAMPSESAFVSCYNFSDSDKCFLWQKENHQRDLLLSSPIGDSVIWKPNTRNDWLDCSGEMAALCAEASLRSSLSPKTTVAFTTKKGGNSKKIKLIAPIVIPKDYIEQRLDVDDPLNGFQLRHAQGGWLQGFALWTTFTSWTRYFKWDSLHPKSGMGSANFRRSIEKQVVDEDGQLASELEQQSRAGDPHEGGVVWPTIAEISLVGGLGCGEFVLRTAIEKIRQEKRGYKYIVLQATESSKRFYERFGFKRVGAICKYGKDSKNVCGYRHWADADEKNLEHHGGPSYMMAKKICDDHTSPSFLGVLEGRTVNRKPTILSHSKQDTFIESSKIFSADEWIQQAERQTAS